MKDLQEQLQKKFDEASVHRLFRSSLGGSELWTAYLMGLGEDPIFRDPESSLHRCNLCHHFIDRYGVLVWLDDTYQIHTLFDGDDWPEEYKESFKFMSDLLKGAKISGLGVITYDQLNRETNYEKCSRTSAKYWLGMLKNAKVYTKEEAEKFGVVREGETKVFHHLALQVPASLIDKSGKTVDALVGDYNSRYGVLKRTMQEIPSSVYETVSDLIDQDSILDAKPYQKSIETLKHLKEEYDTLTDEKIKDNWCWEKASSPAAKTRSTLVGTLCVDIASGKQLEEVCTEWNRRVDPANYMKAKAPITKKQVEEAERFVTENGYIESFTRRLATIEDIKASEILHLNSGDGKIKKPISVFDSIKETTTPAKETKPSPKENIKIDEFMKNILPGTKELEIFFQSRHKNNLVSLTTSQNNGGKRIFKWNNNFSWTYLGNLTGKSRIATAVKAAGGFVDAPFRFSIMWNEDGRSLVDFDAHAKHSPSGREIYYRQKTAIPGGELDVDMIRPTGVGVENIFWKDMSKVPDGEYSFFVHNFDGGSNTGIKAEIVIDNQVFTYQVDKPIPNRDNVTFAKITMKGGIATRIEHNTSYLVGEKKETLYGISTGEFQRVNLVCLSPNCWGDHELGNKHYFFMMEGCKADDKIRGFHIENLCSELLPHKKVLEVLANKMQIEPTTDDQLCGLGFDATVRDEVVVRVNKSRVITIQF